MNIFEKMNIEKELRKSFDDYSVFTDRWGQAVSSFELNELYKIESKRIINDFYSSSLRDSYKDEESSEVIANFLNTNLPKEFKKNITRCDIQIDENFNFEKDFDLKITSNFVFDTYKETDERYKKLFSSETTQETTDKNQNNKGQVMEADFEKKPKFKVNSEDTLLETRDIHTYFETNSKEEAMGYFLYKGFVEANIAFENKTNNGFRYFIADENAELNIDFSQISSKEKEKLINLYKENNAEHFQNEERFKKIEEETSIEMGDPYGEYRYEVKGNQMKENQKNEELAIYSFRDEFGGYDEENEQYFGTEFYFENYNEFKAEQEKRRITDDVTYKETDLIVIKNITAKRHDYYEDTNTDYNISDKFEKKVDAHLIYHICDKFYTDDNDRQFFKQNKIAYDDNGFIQKIQAVGDDNWVDIKDFKNVEELEKYFSEIKNAKKIDTTQQEKKR